VVDDVGSGLAGRMLQEWAGKALKDSSTDVYGDDMCTTRSRKKTNTGILLVFGKRCKWSLLGKRIREANGA
jgi:hypothetical protein